MYLPAWLTLPAAQGGDDPQAPSIEWPQGSAPVDRHSNPAGGAAGGVGEAGGHKGGAVVVGSMAIRAAREARARAAALQRELDQAHEQRAQLQARVAELEAASAATTTATAIKPLPLPPPPKTGKAGSSKGGVGQEGARDNAPPEGGDAEETSAAQQVGVQCGAQLMPSSTQALACVAWRCLWWHSLQGNKWAPFAQGLCAVLCACT